MAATPISGSSNSVKVSAKSTAFGSLIAERRLASLRRNVRRVNCGS